MNRILTILVVLASCAFGAAPVVVPINGVSVTVQSVVPATEFVAVQRVRIYHGVRNDTGENCSIISGDIVTRMPNRLFDVDVTVELYSLQIWGGYAGYAGSATATVKQARNDSPTPFRAIGPAVLSPQWNGKLPPTHMLHYTTSFKIRTHVPTKLPDRLNDE